MRTLIIIATLLAAGCGPDPRIAELEKQVAALQAKSAEETPAEDAQLRKDVGDALAKIKERLRQLERPPVVESPQVPVAPPEPSSEDQAKAVAALVLGRLGDAQAASLMRMVEQIESGERLADVRAWNDATQGVLDAIPMGAEVQQRRGDNPELFDWVVSIAGPGAAVRVADFSPFQMVALHNAKAWLEGDRRDDPPPGAIDALIGAVGMPDELAEIIRARGYSRYAEQVDRLAESLLNAGWKP